MFSPSEGGGNVARQKVSNTKKRLRRISRFWYINNTIIEGSEVSSWIKQGQVDPPPKEPFTHNFFLVSYAYEWEWSIS